MYLNQNNEETKFNENEQKIIKDSVSIKDFIVIGDNEFHEKIKNVEKNVKSKSFKYLNMEEISNYLEQRKYKNWIKNIALFLYLNNRI